MIEAARQIVRRLTELQYQLNSVQKLRDEIVRGKQMKSNSFNGNNNTSRCSGDACASATRAEGLFAVGDAMTKEEEHRCAE
jgi:hypothetical protein